jgi:hypothetical protein
MKEDLGAALRGLRLILGVANKALSGERFSELCGITPGTLNAVETGRRKLNEADKSRIENRLGAVWNRKRGRWVYRFDHNRPYTKAVYAEYRKAIIDDTYSRENDVDKACAALFYTLKRLPKIDYHQVLFDFYEQLHKWAAHSDAPIDVLEFLACMKPEIHLGYTAKDGSIHLMVEYPNYLESGNYLDMKEDPDNPQEPVLKWEILQPEENDTTFSRPGGNKSQKSRASSLETKPK